MEYMLQIMPSLLSGLKMTFGVFAPNADWVSTAWYFSCFSVKIRYLFATLGDERLYLGDAWYAIAIADRVCLLWVELSPHRDATTFEAAVVTFILNYAAYFAEIFRGGLQSVPQGQYDGAKVLGLTRWQTMRKIVLPQVVKIVMPSVGNEVVTLVKDSSLVYVIGLGDLMRAGNIAASRDVTLMPYLLVGLLYLLLTALATVIQRRVETKMNYYR